MIIYMCIHAFHELLLSETSMIAYTGFCIGKPCLLSILFVLTRDSKKLLSEFRVIHWIRIRRRVFVGKSRRTTTEWTCCPGR